MSFYLGRCFVLEIRDYVDGKSLHGMVKLDKPAIEVHIYGAKVKKVTQDSLNRVYIRVHDVKQAVL